MAWPMWVCRRNCVSFCGDCLAKIWVCVKSLCLSMHIAKTFLVAHAPRLCSGRLGYADTKSWTPTLAVGLAVAPEVAAASQSKAHQAHAAHQPHEPFRWHMFLSDFCKTFDTVTVFHKPELYRCTHTLLGCQDAPATIRSDPCPLATDKDPPRDPTVARPYLLYVDSLEPTQLLVSVSIGPGAAPRYLDVVSAQGAGWLWSERWPLQFVCVCSLAPAIHAWSALHVDAQGDAVPSSAVSTEPGQCGSKLLVQYLPLPSCSRSSPIKALVHWLVSRLLPSPRHLRPHASRHALVHPRALSPRHPHPTQNRSRRPRTPRTLPARRVRRCTEVPPHADRGSPRPG